MEEKSSRETSVAKVRKPYTITKQREKWTEEEHNRFLEALKLYGRAWQRIEAYIGTKTAVQIRSHAQKFFTKLEKEALMKGVSPGQVHDIDIPPPRLKRKPSNPYPKKTSTGSLLPSGEAIDDKPSRSFSLQSANQQALRLESDAATENLATTKTMQAKENSEDGSCSEVLNINQDVLASICSLNKGSSSPTFMEFLPTMVSMKEKIAIDKSLLPLKVNKELVKDGIASNNQETKGLPRSCTSLQINFAEVNGSKSNQRIVSSNVNMKVNQDGPKQANCISRNSTKGMQNRGTDVQNPTTVAGQVGGHAAANPSMKPTVSAVSELQNISAISPLQHQFPPLSPLTQCHSDQDAYDSFLNISSAFSSLIISTLLQNPSVHAAASLAASFWPSADADISLHSSPETPGREIPVRHMKPSPSMTSIVAATVAAAYAWWTAQGLLPWFPPNFTFAFTSEPAEMVQAPDGIDGLIHDPLNEDQKVVNPDLSDTPKPQHPSTKPLSSSSSPDSNESVRDENSNSTELKAAKTNNKFQPLITSGLHDLRRKKQDISCVSNTLSSINVAENIILEKHEKVDNEAKETYFPNCSAGVISHCRFRSSRSMNEPWKEVSEEGRLAFEAPLQREVLPQSSSPLHTEDAQTKEEMPMKINDSTGQSSLTNDFGHGNSKASQTGFKPYKRCSVEAKENKAAGREEAGNKKIRLPEEASI